MTELWVDIVKLSHNTEYSCYLQRPVSEEAWLDLGNLRALLVSHRRIAIDTEEDDETKS
jgi:hypothetical protein